MRLCTVFLLMLPFYAAAQPDIVKPMPRKGKLNLLVHPADLLVCEDSPVEFRAFAACPPPEIPKYQWQISTDGKNWDDLAGATSPRLTQLGLARRAHNASQFRVRVSGAGETMYSFPAMLTVESGIFFSKNPERQTVAEGGVVVFSAVAESESGNGVASYTWQVSPYASGVWSAVPGANLPELKLSSVSAAENGNSYRLVARTFNGCDSAVSAPAFLVVSGKPVVSILPLERTLCGGGDATFSVSIDGGNGTEKCQWQADKTGKGNFEDLPSEQSFSLKLKNVGLEMNGWQFRALVQLSDGTAVATRPAKLMVHGSVGFSRQPNSEAVCLGDAVEFEAQPATGGQIPRVFWQISTDGGNFWRNLPDASSNILKIEHATPEQHGQLFRLAAESGQCGIVYSKPAQLTVFHAAKFTQHPRDQKSNIGGSVTFEADFEAFSEGNYGVSWEWSATGGSSWQFMPGGVGKSLVIKNVTTDMRDYLYRMKVLDKKCGRISYSEPARILVE